MSIYDDPKKYAKETRMPLRLAEIWCENQLKLQREIDIARICPKCKKSTLVLEPGSYEENTHDYVYCENDEIPEIDEDGEEYLTECNYTAEPQKEHEPLSSWYDFDVILAFSSGFVGKKIEFCGSLQEWLKFVREEVGKIQPKVTA